MKIAIIGSGLASISAAKTLIDRGIKPTIIDSGDVLETDRSEVVDRMSKQNAGDWNEADLRVINSNSTIRHKKSLPRKFAFGSDYFYGKARQYQKVKFDKVIPPFSYAKGGFSSGWGAATLPPDDNDLTRWPIGNKELKPYFQKILSSFNYSAVDDGLSKIFPIYSKDYNALKLSYANKEILKSLDSYIKNNQTEHVLVGQSRLLVQANNNHLGSGCRYCGQCLSGCVYGHIYKASIELDHLIASQEVDYIANHLVLSLTEIDDKVEVLVKNTSTQSKDRLLFNKILLGAGAVNSTRIVLKSKSLYNINVRLHSTAGFVAPVFRIKKMDIDWPNTNTQPAIFLEYKNDRQSNYWTHAQISTSNELIFARLGIDKNKKGLFQWLKRTLIKHLVLVHVNIHSEFGDSYVLNLRKAKSISNDILYSSYDQNRVTGKFISKSVLKLFNIFRKIGCIVILPAVQNSLGSGSYHVGATMPMKNKPIDELDTNLLGVPKGWKNIHIIDSSIFPSIPATTIGLLIMANAARIADKMKIE